jgi:hypothetical protein
MTGEVRKVCELISEAALTARDSYKVIHETLIDAGYETDKKKALTKHLRKYFALTYEGGKETYHGAILKERLAHEKVLEHGLTLQEEVRGANLLRAMDLGDEQVASLLLHTSGEIKIKTLVDKMKTAYERTAKIPVNKDSKGKNKTQETFVAEDGDDQESEGQSDVEVFAAEVPSLSEYVEDGDSEHKEVLAAFENARNKLNEVRKARGFYPVVAKDEGFKRKGDCRWCLKPGHFERECRGQRRQENHGRHDLLQQPEPRRSRTSHTTRSRRRPDRAIL